MKHFIVYNTQGKILRTGTCQNKCFSLQVLNPGESVLEGKADDMSQKIVGDKVVDKIEEDLSKEKKQKKTPKTLQKKHVTNEMWQNILNRLKALEKNNE